MSKKRIEHFTVKGDPWQKLAILTALLVMIFISIHVIRSLPTKESTFVDGVAAQIETEMAESKIVLSAKGGRRTTAEFSDPVLLTHGSQSRLIVHTARLSETISIANEGWGGWEWTSAYQDIVYEGDAQYTVDLSGLTERDFSINNELKTLTVRIPYAELSPICIDAEQIKFHDVKKGWAAPRDIKLTAQENAQLAIQVGQKMKAKLIDENIIDTANENAKTVVADLLSTTVHSIDPEFTVIVVQ